MSEWVSQIRMKIDVMRNEIKRMQSLADMIQASEEERSLMIAPYEADIEQLYRDDLPLAEILDKSTFYISMEGEGVILRGTHISDLANILENIKRQFGNIFKSVTGFGAKKLPKNFEPTVVGLAAASIVIGLDSPKPQQKAEETLFVGTSTNMYEAAHRSLELLSIVGALLTTDASIDEIAEVIPDPVVRDSAIQAVHDLAPSRKSIFDRVIIGSKSINSKQNNKIVLTQETREHAKNMRKKQTLQSKYGTFSGIVREIDLDAMKFELRRLKDYSDEKSIQCVYSEEFVEQIAGIINKNITVSGQCEYNRENIPRLLKVENLKINNKQPKLMN